MPPNLSSGQTGTTTALIDDRTVSTRSDSLKDLIYQRWIESIDDDVRWLLKEQKRSGGWGYGPRSAMTRLQPDWTDASNSQFAVLALREASDAGLPIRPQSFSRAAGYWRRFITPTAAGATR